MPTENERKFCISEGCEKKISLLAKKHLYINQGYIMASRGLSLRLRKSQDGKVSFLINSHHFTESHREPKHYMTFKCNANGGANRVVEIEKKIDKRDFNDLWPQCMNKLLKYRYIVADEHKQVWEVDFFKTYDKENYFALAEIEMPEGQVKPYHIPEFIKSNLIFEVPLTDCRFSSKLLGDVSYARELYSSLRR